MLDRTQGSEIRDDGGDVSIRHHTVMIGGVRLKLSPITTDSFADGADDFLITPVSQSSFSVKGDIGCHERRLLIEHVACTEGFRARDSGLTVVEWRVAQEAPRDAICKILSSRNKVGGCHFRAAPRLG
jgi:hypothetical protein